MKPLFFHEIADLLLKVPPKLSSFCCISAYSHCQNNSKTCKYILSLTYLLLLILYTSYLHPEFPQNSTQSPLFHPPPVPASHQWSQPIHSPWIPPLAPSPSAATTHPYPMAPHFFISGPNPSSPHGFPPLPQQPLPTHVSWPPTSPSATTADPLDMDQKAASAGKSRTIRDGFLGTLSFHH